ncbi:MAG: HAD-IA family hydrolase [Lachnospiraceae bacterium]|nr:HAD-IA family hydrolase [Lachnospiraceae bacterium]
MNDKKSVRGVIFDMDGILFDTEKLYERFWMEAAAVDGFTMTPQDVSSIRSTDAALCEEILRKRFGKDFSYPQVKARRIALMEEYTRTQGIEKKKGVDELLSFLQNHGIKIALATTSPLVRAEEFLRQGGIRSYFDTLITGDMVSHSKPDPEIFLLAAKSLGLSTEDCLILEDSFNGVRAAYRAKIPVIMVPDRDEPSEEIRQKAMRVSKDLLEVLQFLEKYGFLVNVCQA